MPRRAPIIDLQGYDGQHLLAKPAAAPPAAPAAPHFAPRAAPLAVPVPAASEEEPPRRNSLLQSVARPSTQLPTLDLMVPVWFDILRDSEAWFDFRLPDSSPWLTQSLEAVCHLCAASQGLMRPPSRLQIRVQSKLRNEASGSDKDPTHVSLRLSEQSVRSVCNNWNRQVLPLWTRLVNVVRDADDVGCALARHTWRVWANTLAPILCDTLADAAKRRIAVRATADAKAAALRKERQVTAKACTDRIGALADAIETVALGLEPAQAAQLKLGEAVTWLRQWEQSLAQPRLVAQTEMELPPLGWEGVLQHPRYADLEKRYSKLKETLGALEQDFRKRCTALRQVREGKKHWEDTWTGSQADMTEVDGLHGMDWQRKLDEAQLLLQETQNVFADHKAKTVQARERVRALRTLREMAAGQHESLQNNLRTLAAQSQAQRRLVDQEQQALFALAWRTGIRCRTEVRRATDALRAGHHSLLRALAEQVEHARRAQLGVLEQLTATRRVLLEYSVAAARPAVFVLPQLARELDEERDRVQHELSERELHLRACIAHLPQECVFRVFKPLAELLSAVALVVTPKQSLRAQAPHLLALAQVPAMRQVFQGLACTSSCPLRCQGGVAGV